jgi:hypothetical protein
MQVGRAAPAPAPASTPALASTPAPASTQAETRADARLSRRLYLPTLVIAGLAAWLSWRGWTALGDAGIARSMNASRYQLAGPVVLGFLAAVCTLE